jgi:hypothetical protein
MAQDLNDYLNELAHSAVERCHARMADRRFFESVKQRIAHGEDLSSEVQQLRGVSKRDALFVVNQLIKRCDTDMQSFWTLPRTSGIQSHVTFQEVAEELIPRFNATYTTRTEVGPLTIIATSLGNYTDFKVDTSRIKQADTEAALRELGHQLLLARLQQADFPG